MDEVYAHLNVDFNKLVCVVAQINLKESRNVVSLSHWQLAQCRVLLLLSDTEVVVCPDPSFLEEIIIVAPRHFHQKGILDVLIRDSNLTLKEEAVQLTPEIVQAALQFSLVVRLYPYWNAVVKSESTEGDVLVSGARVLLDSSNSPVDAVKLRVFAKDHEMWIGICAFRLRLPIIRPEYLDISFKYVDKILSSPGRCIDESKIGDPLVYVLPTLEKGRITFLMNGLPLESEFRNWKHLQQHWKETFGLLLPGLQSDEPHLVAFVKLESNRFFLYPLRCLLKTSPVVLKHDDQWSLVKSLLKRIKSLVQIRLLEVNENHFLAANHQAKKQPEIAEKVDSNGASSNESNAAEFSKSIFKNLNESTSQVTSQKVRRYKLSLKRPSERSALDQHIQSAESKTNDPQRQPEFSKVPVVSLTLTSHATPKKRKLFSCGKTPRSTIEHSAPNVSKTSSKQMDRPEEENHPEPDHPEEGDHTEEEGHQEKEAHPGEKDHSEEEEDHPEKEEGHPEEEEDRQENEAHPGEKDHTGEEYHQENHSKRPKHPEQQGHSKQSPRSEHTKQPEQLKKRRQFTHRRVGRRLMPGETIEKLFEKGKLHKAHRDDLINWLRDNKIRGGMNELKEVLLSKVQSALRKSRV